MESCDHAWSSLLIVIILRLIHAVCIGSGCFLLLNSSLLGGFPVHLSVRANRISSSVGVFQGKLL